MINKKLLIAIPTYNRSDIINYFLEKTYPTIEKTPNVYLGIYDSSTDDLTEKITKSFVGEIIFYKRYDAGVGEEKCYDILCNEGKTFDYIWFCSDRKVLNLSYLLPLIENAINNSVDLILFSDYRIDTFEKTIHSSSEIGVRFFEIVNLAKTIIGKAMFPFMSEYNNFMKYSGSHFSVQALIVDFCGLHTFKALQYNLRDQDIAETGALPFVHEWSRSAVWQWSKSWCDTVDKLPASYSNIREDIIQSNKMFSLKKVLARRANGTEFPHSDIKEYKQYIKRINSSVVPVYMAKIFPIFLLRIPYRVYKILKNSSRREIEMKL